MLTFNSESFETVPSDELWAQFCSWVVDRAGVYNATHWSATVEKASRVHAHAYFSWHGAGVRGIDHRTTEAWRFKQIMPRVDVNQESRGPWHWLRAAQHGQAIAQQQL